MKSGKLHVYLCSSRSFEPVLNRVGNFIKKMTTNKLTETGRVKDKADF